MNKKIILIMAVSFLIISSGIIPAVTAQEEEEEEIIITPNLPEYDPTAVSSESGIQAGLTKMVVHSGSTSRVNTVYPPNTARIQYVDNDSTGVSAGIGGAFLCDDYGIPDIDQAGLSMGSASKDGETWIQYTSYKYCVPVYVRTHADVDYNLVENTYGFLYDYGEYRTAWFLGGTWAPIDASTYRQPFMVNNYNVKVFSADITKQAVGKVTVDLDVRFKFTMDDAAWASEFRDANNITWVRNETWTGIRECWLGQIKANYVDLIQADQPWISSAAPLEGENVSDSTYSGISREGYVTAGYEGNTYTDRTIPVSQEREVTGMQTPYKPAEVTLQPGGRTFSQESTRVKIGDQNLSMNGYSQEWTVPLTMTLKPAFWLVQQRVDWQDVWFIYKRGWFGTTGDFSVQPNYKIATVGAQARNVYACYYLVFNVVVGSKYTGVRPALTTEEQRPLDVPKDFTELVEPHLESIIIDTNAEQFDASAFDSGGIGFLMTLILVGAGVIVVYFVYQAYKSKQDRPQIVSMPQMGPPMMGQAPMQKYPGMG